MNIKNLTTEQLKQLLDEIQAELQSRKQKHKFKIEINYFDPRKHGHAYVCRLKKKDGKIVREFFDGMRLWDRKHKQYDAVFEFEAADGDIIEAREGGSWKNEYRNYYVVENGELKMIDRAEALERLNG